VLTLVIVAGPASPAGIEVHNSDCASGGFDYFFFDDGVVIAKCWGCETRPHVQAGRWRREGDAILVKMDHEWFGQGKGRIVEVASVNVYETYVAVVRTGGIKTEQEKFSAEDLVADGKDGCEEARRHRMPADPQAFLRLFDGEHPETFQRALGPVDVHGRTPKELRLMRNEVFARYGLRFRDPTLRVHFEKQPGYRSDLSDVDAFLSDIERRNVAVLLAAEQSSGTRAP
jgi:hypothetical protein